MNKDYLYSIVNLYLNRENDNKKIALNIDLQENDVEFSFSMTDNDIDKTSLVIPRDEYDEIIVDLINQLKQDLMVIDEKYNYENENGSCHYLVKFNNGRKISFDGFTIIETNNIRNVLYDIKINQNEIRLEDIEQKQEMAYKPRLRLQQAGFSSYATLLLVVIFFALVLVVSLFVFKSFIN
jgi:hypothetical protein